MLAVIALFGASCGEQAGKILRDAETDAPALTAERVRQLLNVHDELAHIAVEINRPSLAGVVLFRQNDLA